MPTTPTNTSALQHASAKVSAGAADLPLRVILAAGDILRLTPTRALTNVTCLSGTCWLTQEGDALDHLLGAGMSHQPGQRGLTLIQAFSDCVLELPSAAVRGSRRSAA